MARSLARFTVATLSTMTVLQLVRSNLRAITVLADAGISPRYLDWTVRSAADDCGVNLDRLAYRLNSLAV